MFRTFASFWLILLAAGPLLRADESADFREFTDKRGQKMTARLLGVSPDHRLMHIVRQDGREFDSEINLLSLDDQQFIKDWMKQAPTAGSAAATPVGGETFRIDLTIARANGESESHRSEFYKFETKQNLYRVTLRNLSRTSLDGARVEYAIVWRDDAVVYEAKDTQTWTYTTGVYGGADSRVKRLGSLPLDPLRFNASITVDSDAVPIDQVLYEGSESVQADDLIGIKVKVISATGQVLHEGEFGSAGISTLTWEQIAGLPDPLRYD